MLLMSDIPVIIPVRTVMSDLGDLTHARMIALAPDMSDLGGGGGLLRPLRYVRYVRIVHSSQDSRVATRCPESRSPRVQRSIVSSGSANADIASSRVADTRIITRRRFSVT